MRYSTSKYSQQNKFLPGITIMRNTSKASIECYAHLYFLMHRVAYIRAYCNNQLILLCDIFNKHSFQLIVVMKP